MQDNGAEQQESEEPKELSPERFALDCLKDLGRNMGEDSLLTPLARSTLKEVARLLEVCDPFLDTNDEIDSSPDESRFVEFHPKNPLSHDSISFQKRFSKPVPPPAASEFDDLALGGPILMYNYARQDENNDVRDIRITMNVAADDEKKGLMIQVDTNIYKGKSLEDIPNLRLRKHTLHEYPDVEYHLFDSTRFEYRDVSLIVETKEGEEAETNYSSLEDIPKEYLPYPAI